jgi:hypothetical protein
MNVNKTSLSICNTKGCPRVVTICNKKQACRGTEYNRRPEIKLRHKDYWLQRTYGITLADWDALFESQGRRCGNPGCRITEHGGKNWATDHDHVTGKVRSILCQGCNVALGSVNESSEKLAGLIQYLKEHEHHAC